jgi:hypothetical protein
MAPMVRHFLPNGMEYKGPTHKMGDMLMTGAVHSPMSVVLTHKGGMKGGSAAKKAMTDMGARMAKLRAMRGKAKSK